MPNKTPEKPRSGLCGAISWSKTEEWLTPAQIAAYNASGRDVEVIPPLRRTNGTTYCRVWVREIR